MTNQNAYKERMNSTEVKNFINKYFPSISHIEVLLLLYEKPYQEFGLKMLQEITHLNSTLITNILEHLIKNKMVLKKGEKNSAYWYLKNLEANNIIEVLNYQYKKDKNELINLIKK
jgi:hypothetical protein